APGDSNAWRPIPVIVDAVLSLEAQAAAEGDVGAQAPIILGIQAGVEVGDLSAGSTGFRRSRNRKLLRRCPGRQIRARRGRTRGESTFHSLEIRERREDESAVEARRGALRVTG